MKKNKAIHIHPSDNVAVALSDLFAGEGFEVAGSLIALSEDIPKGHKVAITPIEPKHDVVKYGFSIGRATSRIVPGDWVHVHNLKTRLTGISQFRYEPFVTETADVNDHREFQGYERENGDVGIRNEIWVIPTVGCVNELAERLVDGVIREKLPESVEGVFAFTHPFGCSQLGDDHERTQEILAGLARHPNAGGVLVVGLGCENNGVRVFREKIGEFNEDHIRFLVAQEVEDELETGKALLAEIVSRAGGFKRKSLPVAKLKIGLKCGGSDGFSGLTANPLVGRISDMFVARDATTVLTETPEMFGAETLLLNRSADRSVFDHLAGMINGFKNYYLEHGKPVSENPSPGNRIGGITTLEEKSLGCVQKGGTTSIKDALQYGERLKKRGLNVLNGPGNDMVATTALAASGAQMALFTTGRGTPFGGPIPTVKISSNSDLAKKKPHWIDFDAGRMIAGEDIPSLADELFEMILEIASGKKTARNELNEYRSIAIWKGGVTL